MGEVLAAAIINGGLRPDLTHIVGHGLGAHCAGKAARTVEEITSFKVAQITGKKRGKGRTTEMQWTCVVSLFVCIIFCRCPPSLKVAKSIF